MDLTAWLLRHTPIRPLIVSAPGGTADRLAVEQAAREWGWELAASPAEGNLLVVAGAVEQSYLDVVWRQIPVPRGKAVISDGDDVRQALTAAVATLRDPHQQEPDDMPMPATVHSGHGDRESSDHMHGHHIVGMQMPGGISMADRAEDRDGLKLDVLHVSLGPVLSDWPAGLIVHATLQGDVLQDTSVEVIGKQRAGGYWTAELACARRLDSCGRLLAVVGWESAARQARCLRDEVLSGHDVRPAFDRWARRVRRSLVLRWSLAGVGEWNRTDAADRLVTWIDQADTSLRSSGDMDDSSAALAALPELLAGCELASARLVVASLDPDTDQVIAHD